MGCTRSKRSGRNAILRQFGQKKRGREVTDKSLGTSSIPGVVGAETPREDLHNPAHPVAQGPVKIMCPASSRVTLAFLVLDVNS